MINAVSFSAKAKAESQKFSGKTHNRKDELSVYREEIAKANAKMHKAADEGNLDLAKFWSQIIDDAQSKIFAIIDQEDNHNYKKIDTYTKAGKDVVDVAEKVVDAGSKIMLVA